MHIRDNILIKKKCKMYWPVHKLQKYVRKGTDFVHLGVIYGLQLRLKEKRIRQIRRRIRIRRIIN